MRLSPVVKLRRAGRCLALLALAGCVAGTAESALLERAGNERSCPPDKLKVTSLGASAYRVEGCGPPETFVCVSYQGWVCTKEGGPQSSRQVIQTIGALAGQKAQNDLQDWIFQQSLQQPAPELPLTQSPPPPPPPAPSF